MSWEEIYGDLRPAIWQPVQKNTRPVSKTKSAGPGDGFFTEKLYEGVIDQSFTPLDTYTGKVGRLLMSIPRLISYEKAYYKFLQDLLAQMKGIHFTFLIENAAGQQSKSERIENKLDEIGRSTGTSVSVIKIDTDHLTRGEMSLWVQDSFIPFIKKEAPDSSQDCRLTFSTSVRFDNEQLIVSVSEIPKIQKCFGEELDVQSSGIGFEAGNILVAENFVLVGKDIFLEKINPVKSEASFTERIKELFGGKPIIYVESQERIHIKPDLETEPELPDHREIMDDLSVQGSDGIDTTHYLYSWQGVFQPIYHIDLFITLLGENKDGRFQILVGNPCPGFNKNHPQITEEICRIAEAQIIDTRNRILEAVGNLSQALQDIVDFDLIWIDLPLTYHISNGIAWTWYWASYNNSIVENTKDNKIRINMPAYGNPSGVNNQTAFLQQLDHKVNTILQNAGFETNLINADFHIPAVRHGSLRCLTNCVHRFFN